MNKKQPRFNLISYAHVQTYYTHEYKYAKIPPDAHHTPLYTHTIIHTMLLPDKHPQKILTVAHRTLLHPHTIIHAKIIMIWTFSHIRKLSTNDNCYNIQTYPVYIIVYTKRSGWDNVPNNTWRPNLNPGIIRVREPGRTTTFLK